MERNKNVEQNKEKLMETHTKGCRLSDLTVMKRNNRLK